MKIKVRTASDVRDHYAEVLEDARFRNIGTLVERHGQRVAIVVNLGWYETHRGDCDPSAWSEDYPAVAAAAEGGAVPGLPGDDLPE